MDNYNITHYIGTLIFFCGSMSVFAIILNASSPKPEQIHLSGHHKMVISFIGSLVLSVLFWRAAR